MKKILVLLVILSGLCIPNKASALELFGLDILSLDTLSSESNFCDSSFRKKAAMSMAEYFEGMNKAIPNLSPAEKEWLNSELGSQNNERAKNAFLSKEYNLREIKNYAEQNFFILKSIAEGQSPDNEAFFWLMFVRNNLDEVGNFHLIQLNSTLPNIVQKYGTIWWCKELSRECYSQALTSMTNLIVARFAMPATGQDLDCKKAN